MQRTPPSGSCGPNGCPGCGRQRNKQGMIQCRICRLWWHFASAATDRQPYTCRTFVAALQQDGGAVGGTEPNDNADQGIEQITKPRGDSPASQTQGSNATIPAEQDVANSSEDDLARRDQSQIVPTNQEQLTRELMNVVNRSTKAPAVNRALIEQIRAQQTNQENAFRTAMNDQRRAYEQTMGVMTSNLIVALKGTAYELVADQLSKLLC